MATIQKLLSDIAAIQSAGRAALADKGIETSANATIYDLMQSIEDIPSGGGIHYSAVDYDAATNTYTLTEADDQTSTHTLTCTYDAQGRIDGMVYDDKEIAVTYNNDGTVTVGGAVVDVSEYAATGGVNPFALTDYIASSGTQYIDTGYIVQSNTKFEVVYSGITSSLSGQYPTLYGARTDYQNNSCQFLVRQTTTDRGFYTWSDRNGTIDENIVSMSTWFGRKIVLTVDKNGLLLQSANAFYTTSGVSNAYSGTPVNNLPIFIFALNNGGSAPLDTFLTGKLYLFRIYEGNTLVHEFLPHKDENNIVCLKDTVTGNIKYNAGTGAFTYGTDA